MQSVHEFVLLLEESVHYLFNILIAGGKKLFPILVVLALKPSASGQQGEECMGEVCWVIYNVSEQAARVVDVHTRGERDPDGLFGCLHKPL